MLLGGPARRAFWKGVKYLGSLTCHRVLLVLCDSKESAPGHAMQWAFRALGLQDWQ